MYHIEDSDYLNEKYYRKTYSVCPECLERLPAEVIEENEKNIFSPKQVHVEIPADMKVIEFPT